MISPSDVHKALGDLQEQRADVLLRAVLVFLRECGCNVEFRDDNLKLYNALKDYL